MTNNLPPGWASTSLGSICLPVSKTDPRATPDLEFEYVDIGGISPGSGRIQATKSLKGSEAPSRARQVVHAGDIILSTVRTYQRKTAIVPAELHGAVASTGFSVLRPASGIDSWFVLYQLLSQDFVNRLNPQQTGTSYPAVRDKDVQAMHIFVAPTAEQGRIVAAIEEHFSRLDAVESTLHIVLQRIAVFESSLLANMFYTNDTPPSDWRLTTIGDVAEVQLGRQRSPQHHTGPQMRPYLRSANITWEGIFLGDVKQMNFDDADFETFKLEPGDLLLNEASGSPGEVGKPAIWNGELDDCCFQNTLLRLRSREIDVSYLYWYCYATARSGRFGEAGRGVNIRHLGKQGLARFPIPVAPEGQRGEIVERLKAEFAQTACLEQAARSALDRVVALRRSILAEAFSGRLTPQIDGEEPASVLLEQIAATRIDEAVRPDVRLG